jgi:2-furoyl-CoA dehydrogenase FAD binding subunit
MKPNRFEYVRPRTIDEALAILANADDGVRIIAGGLSLVPMMNFRLAEPKLLVDIASIEELAYVRVSDGFVDVGAVTTQARLMAWPKLPELVPLLAQAMPHIGHFQTRSRGTVGGSIAHSDPTSELPLCLLVLDGSVTLSSKAGERRVRASDFQMGMLATAKRPDELLTAVRFPVADSQMGFAFHEMAMRHGDLAICAVAATATIDRLRIGVAGVGEQPAIRDLPPLSGKALDEALNAFAWELGGHDDVHATARYRRQLVRHLGHKAIMEAQECAKRSQASGGR